MAEATSFSPAKLICGLLSSADECWIEGERRLTDLYGPVDIRSRMMAFDLTDYYEPQMGKGLKRLFLGFERLVEPEALSDIKIRTNALEDEIRISFGADLRVINLDPGILTASALIMATAKDFSHRIPLRNGIYGHLEFLFGKNNIRFLDWTYPDFRKEDYQSFFLQARKSYLLQLKSRSR